MKVVNVGLIGFGTVGSGVVRLLLKERRFIRDRTGIDIRLRWVCDRDFSTPRGIVVPEKLITKNWKKVVYDPRIDVVVELVGGCRVAKEIVLQAIQNGKAVVTANKALLAEYGEQIFSEVERYRGEIYYEASVGGGIPVIKALREGLVANRIDLILGILNGTSNYILTKMKTEGVDFHKALRQAQQEGYAESDPKLDIEGIDSAHKLSILGMLVTGGFIDFKRIYVEGISNVTPLDINYADELGYKIKLLAIFKQHKDSIELRVHPTLLPVGHPLSSVDGVYNAVFIRGSFVGDTLFYGRGAGQLPTASAVVSDIVDVAKRLTVEKEGVYAPRIIGKQRMKIISIEDIDTRYYLRFSVVDRPGVLARISGILGSYGISIASVIQLGRQRYGSVPVVMMLHKSKGKNVNDALKEINRLGVVKARAVKMVVEE